MVIPWLIMKRNAHNFVSQLSAFDGIAFVLPHKLEHVTFNTSFSNEIRQVVLSKLSQELDSDNHIWIASDHHGTLLSFLHAESLSREEAQVDFLCSVKWGYNQKTESYEGCGEIFCLLMLLEQKGIMRVHIPLGVDLNVKKALEPGWFEQEKGIYVRTTEKKSTYSSTHNSTRS